MILVEAVRAAVPLLAPAVAAPTPAHAVAEVLLLPAVVAVAIPAEAIVVELAEVIPVVATVAAVAEVDTQVVEVAAEAAVDIADKIRWSVRPPYFFVHARVRISALLTCSPD